MMRDLIHQIEANHALETKIRRLIQCKRSWATRFALDAMPQNQFEQLVFSNPHWRKIGCKKGQYQICRRDHSLGYTHDNTFIGTQADNIRERLQRCGPPGPRPKRQLSPAQLAARAAKRRAQWRRSNRRRTEQNLASANPKNLTTQQRAARRRALLRIYCRAWRKRQATTKSIANQEQPERHNASQTIH